jgi:hypothetical protein
MAGLALLADVAICGALPARHPHKAALIRSLLSRDVPPRQQLQYCARQLARPATGIADVEVLRHNILSFWRAFPWARDAYAIVLGDACSRVSVLVATVDEGGFRPDPWAMGYAVSAGGRLLICRLSNVFNMACFAVPVRSRT